MVKNNSIENSTFKRNYKRETDIQKSNVLKTQFVKILDQNNFKYLKTKHSWHLVDPSPWPLVAALGAFFMTSGGVLYMHNFLGGGQLFLTGFLTVLYVMYTWWRDIIREATFEEQHTFSVQRGLRLGMVLFIVSEVMFFFAFFWAFFHLSLSPVFNVGGVWPPDSIQTIKTSGIPLTNTFFLLSSVATVAWAYHAVRGRAKKQAIIALILTSILALIFTVFQGLMYVEDPFKSLVGILNSTLKNIMLLLVIGFTVLFILINLVNTIKNKKENKRESGGFIVVICVLLTTLPQVKSAQCVPVEFVLDLPANVTPGVFLAPTGAFEVYTNGFAQISVIGESSTSNIDGAICSDTASTGVVGEIDSANNSYQTPVDQIEGPIDLQNPPGAPRPQTVEDELIGKIIYIFSCQ